MTYTLGNDIDIGWSRWGCDHLVVPGGLMTFEGYQ